MSDKQVALEDESRSADDIETSKGKFINKMKSAGRSAWRELSLDSKASYASRTYDWLGNRLIGNAKDLDIAQYTNDFYWDKEDRDFPKGELADDSYEQRKQIFIEDFRQELRYGIAKFVVPVGMLLCAVMLLLGQVSLSGYQKAQSVAKEMKVEKAAESNDFSQTSPRDLKVILEAAQVQGRTKWTNLTTREKAAFAEYQKRPNSGYADYHIIELD